eukprot:365942-Chlamydomonas_euryale.AAC.34
MVAPRHQKSVHTCERVSTHRAPFPGQGARTDGLSAQRARAKGAMSETESECSEASASRTSSATASELRRTLESINLNAPRRLMQHNSVAPAQPYNPPSVLSWLVGTWKGKGQALELTTGPWLSFCPQSCTMHPMTCMQHC